MVGLAQMAAKTALLVIDVQAFFSSMTHACLPNILTLIKHFSSTSRHVIFTQHGHSEKELSENPYHNQLVKKWGPNGSIKIGSDDWQLMDELKPHLPHGEKDGKTWIVPKNTYSAFLAPWFVEETKPSLLSILEDEQIERVVVCGVMTDCCVDTTGRDAFNRGYETWLVSDACGSANKRQHVAGLRGFEFGFGEVLETKAAIQRLKEA